WEDRYHSTAIQSDHHLVKCMIYIDLNMVRAGVVRHPENWRFCGYNDIQSSRQRYRLIDRSALIDLLNLEDLENLRHTYKKWIDDAVEKSAFKRESRWTESVAVGSREFVERITDKLGPRLRRRGVLERNGIFELHEYKDSYSYNFNVKNDLLSRKQS
ncbi:MAG: transposase, partial [Candidatus Aminicenantes bacterium]|nr:transposase [Candidatus Aminicenantes bacterium]